MSIYSLRGQNYGQDVISVCVFCREDATVLLNVHPDEDLARFPTLPIIKTSWRLTVRKLISMVNGLSGKEISLMRITKFWLPDISPACHVIYKVKCPFSEKKLLKLQSTGVANLKWFSLDQVQQMCLAGQLTSPELLEYVAHSLQPRSFYPLTSDPEASKEGFDMLNEVVEKNIIIDIDTSFLTPQELLLKLAHFTKNEQKKIYKEFWIRTFPNLLMNKVQFEKFVAELGWKKEEWPGLFLCADVAFRGGMTFREFLLFLAATEPETPHGIGSGEIRCQYIFRYFDKNRDNILDNNELRSLIFAISSVKGNLKQNDIEKSMESYVQELGLGPKKRLSMGTFVKKVGELKFRGTSSIFRSAISVLRYVPPLLQNDEKLSPTPSVQQCNKKMKSSIFQGLQSLKGVSTYSMVTPAVGSGIMRNSAPKKEFEIATHAVRLTRAGILEEVRPIDRVTYGKSGSLGNEDHFIRVGSVEYYDEKSPPNELLSALSYFARELSITTKSAFRKPQYSWEKYEMHNLMPTLLSVCDSCITIMAKEPRMLQLTSPIYVLGDLHGNYPDLMAFEQVLWNLGLALSPCSLLFLGDYVDRGPFGIEIVSYLFAQKVKNPTKIFLLRGNHEIRSIQKAFTFYLECQRRFGEDHFYEVWNMINRVFDVMPLAAVIDGRLFCCHGGIPPPWLCTRIDMIDTIPCPLSIPEEQSLLAWEIMWNDPVKSDYMSHAVAQEMDANEGFAMNIIRKTGRVFSFEALETFLKRNNLSHVIRAHEVKNAGFQVQQGGKLLTVFSSSGYCGGPNEAACVFVSQDKIRVFRINTGS